MLNKFNQSSACAKCGHNVAITEHEHAVRVSKHHSAYYKRLGVLTVKKGFIRNRYYISECMRRRCGRCQYQWAEKPLDAESDEE